MKLRNIISLLMVFFISVSFTKSPSQGALVLEQVFEKNKSMQKVTVTIAMKERFDKKYIDKKTSFKIEYNPTKIYLKQETPDPQYEVIFLEGQNDNKAIVNPSSFPWITLKLDPLGNTMRKNNHHSIYKSGFSFFVDVLEHLFDKYKSEFANMVDYQGITDYSGIPCHKMIVNNPYFKYITYTVQPGDNLEMLSHKFFICDYMILEKNPEIKSFEALKAGSQILIPSDYAKLFILYIDAKTLLPVATKIYDDDGLFEEYNYIDVNLNPSFTGLDFDRNNPAYGFK